MLLMAWGGEEVKKEHADELRDEIRRSRKEIEGLGVAHGDFSTKNLLWNAELQRVLGRVTLQASRDGSSFRV